MNFNELQELIQTESFFHGYENTMGYDKHWVEIFKNPTQRELNELGNYNIGMLLDEKDVYVWNRNLAYHKHIMREIKKTNVIPILFDYDDNHCFCLITDASSITPYHHNPEVREIIENNPWMKRFSDIVIEYYDSAIVGDWEEYP